MGKPASSSKRASEAGRPAALLGPPTADPQVSPRHLGKLQRALELVARPQPERDPPVLIWLCGPPGSGKRTLARTARDRLGDQDIEFLVAEAHGATDEILEPVLGAARELIGRLRQRELDDDRRWRDVWRHIRKRHAPALDRVLPEVDWGEEIVPYPDLDPEEERERLLDHLAGLFVRIAEHVPVVLQIDHADLLDVASQDLLLTLARIVRTRRQGLAAGLPVLPPPRLALLVTTIWITTSTWSIGLISSLASGFGSALRRSIGSYPLPEHGS